MKQNGYQHSTRLYMSFCRRFVAFMVFVIGFANCSQNYAQTSGTTGNTITFDGDNCTELYSGNENTTAFGTYFSYLRHNQAPIQILNANPMGNNNTIAALQEADGNGVFASTHMANNMVFTETNPGELEFYNFKGYYDSQCFAIIAPKGYRIIEYSMDICSNKHPNRKVANSNGANEATIMRYTYVEGTTVEWNAVSGETMALTGKNSEIFSHTLTNVKNVLYFKVKYKDSSTQWCVHMNSLRITYVIDDPFEADVPNEDGENKVATGILNLGQFKHIEYGNFFIRNNVSDHENINIVATDGAAEMSVADRVIKVAGNHTYYIESPAKYRIVEATMNFQLAPGSSETTYDATTALVSGEKYKLSDGNGHYLTLNNNRNVVNTNNQSEATIWEITASGRGYTITTTIYGTMYYLYASNGTISTRTSSFDWTYNVNRTFTYIQGLRTYGIRYNNNSWNASRTDYNTPTRITFYKETIHSVSGNESYTATVYKADGNLVQGTADISTTNPTQSITVSEMNNDAVKFDVSGGHAGFTINLKLLPLDPTLQTIEIGYYSNSQGMAMNTVSVSANNFNFGNDIVIPILTPDQGGQNKIVFRNAYNENIGKGVYCFLVDSEYEQNSFNDQTDNKVDADKAGLVKLEFSNIKMLTPGQATEYQEYVFDKNQAGYQDIMIGSADAAKTIYIYSGDRPLYCIMTDAGLNQNTHISHTFYNATVKTEDISEVPEIELVELYTETLKGNNNKNTSISKDTRLDTTHKFYGVKVTSKVVSGSGTASGYLTNEAIINAIEDKMKTLGSAVYSDDWFRTILYIDMSELKSVAASIPWQQLMTSTADNCLYFMPSGMDYVANNVVKGGEGGRSTGDVIIYDQQPFYSPYNFTTGTRKAHYERLGTNDKPAVANTTIILPFTVPTNDDGNAMISSDEVNVNVKFLTFETFNFEPGDRTNTYKITASLVTTNALANNPYHVVVDIDHAVQGSVSYLLEVIGASFAKTPSVGVLKGEDNVLTGWGSFNGMEKNKAVVPDVDDFLYFTKNAFWKSSTLKNDDTVKFLPYRVYYTYDTDGSDSGVKTVDHFCLSFGNAEDDVDAIELVNADNRLLVGASDGTLYVKTNADTEFRIYDMSGRQIVTDNILAGSVSRYSLNKGIYIANGKKILVK